MIFRRRPVAPTCLTESHTRIKMYRGIENQVAWGLQYEAKRNDIKKSNDFKWATYQGQKVNQLIEDDLRNMTQNHCAFCDFFPLRQPGRTIEHFRPKTHFPTQSHLWTNLFYCCHSCQEKGEQFHVSLLKPDEVGYDFSSFFVCRFDGEAIFIEPNPRGSIDEQTGAETTISLYGLNRFDRPEDRFRVWRQFNDSNNPIIDEFPYRYLFD